jgi:hypothetical protein
VRWALKPGNPCSEILGMWMIPVVLAMLLLVPAAVIAASASNDAAARKSGAFGPEK